jgi:hypothetical protein
MDSMDAPGGHAGSSEPGDQQSPSRLVELAARASVSEMAVAVWLGLALALLMIGGHSGPPPALGVFLAVASIAVSLYAVWRYAALGKLARAAGLPSVPVWLLWIAWGAYAAVGVFLVVYGPAGTG